MISARSLALFSLFLLTVPAAAQPAQPKKPAERYEYRREHDVNGTGKFYMNREIAQVMGHLAAGWLERPEREKEEQPAKLMAALKFKPGDVVADVGAGSGYHTFRMAPVVGPKGKILAVDIQQEMLDLIKERMKKEEVTNVVPILGTITDPKLPAGGVDLILLVDVYGSSSSSSAWKTRRCRSSWSTR
jgi:16S rRNA C967 or C1407 C5-methylase (RsmB/RsmF family)